MTIHTLKKDYSLPLAVAAFVMLMLAMVQLKVPRPMIILERFIPGAGWFEIILIAIYGGFVAYKMQNPVHVPRWRKITWTIFSSFFFLQLILGLVGFDKFLMTGKLHLPIPTMIISGPIYRGHTSFMTILFLSTIFLAGPSWCSQLCYFGAFDRLASSGKTKRGKIKNKLAIKSTIFFLVIVTTIILRWFNVSNFWATILGISFGLIGIGVMIYFSRKQHRMVHCSTYCPIGTTVNVLKYANPFRMYIDDNCNLCMRCVSHCKYDALNPEDVKKKKPSYSCTLCGDCLSACRDQSIKYKYFNLGPTASRNLYLFLTISLHAVFLALARI
jgi:polyferredoxin